MGLIGKIISAFVIVGLVLAVLWYFIIYKAAATNPAAINSDPSQGRPPYYSKATYDLITSGTLGGAILAQFNETATTDIRPWRLLADDEFSSCYGTYTWTFGYDVKNPPSGKAGFNSILQWAKGMNLDPVHLQGYLCLFKDDITAFSQQCKQYSYPFTEVNVGSFYA